MCSSVTLTSPATTSSPRRRRPHRRRPRGTARPGSDRRSPPAIRGAPLRRASAPLPGLRSVWWTTPSASPPPLMPPIPPTPPTPPIRGPCCTLHQERMNERVAARPVDDVVQRRRTGPAPLSWQQRARRRRHPRAGRAAACARRLPDDSSQRRRRRAIVIRRSRRDGQEEPNRTGARSGREHEVLHQQHARRISPLHVVERDDERLAQPTRILRSSPARGAASRTASSPVAGTSGAAERTRRVRLGGA